MSDIQCASHQMILAKAIMATQHPVLPGGVLELGCGFFSTPMLHGLCGNRKLITLDTDASWLGNFLYLASPNHIIEPVAGWDELLYYHQNWSIVFVDHGSIDYRVKSINAVRHTSDYIIVHDTECGIYNFEPTLSTFRFRADYKTVSPWTTIISDKVFPAFMRNI